MPTSHSLEILRDWWRDPQRTARAAVLNGDPIPAATAAALEARGINVSDLEARIIQNQEFKR